MNRLSLLALLSFAGLILFAPGLSPAADEVEISGTYSCAGKNPGGTPYSGTVVISKKGDTYRLLWTIGRSKHHGTGIREGQVLSVCFVAGNSAGVASYKIEPADEGAKLLGRWAAVGHDKTFTETLWKGKLSEAKGVVGPARKPVLEELPPGLPPLVALPEEPKPRKSSAA